MVMCNGEKLAVIPFPSVRRNPADQLELLREIVHDLPFGVFVVDSSGRVLVSNLSREAGGLFANGVEAVTIGAPFEEILRYLPFDKEGFERAREQISRLIVGSATLTHETYELATADPYQLTVRATHLSGQADLTMVVLSTSHSDERGRLSRRRRHIHILRAQDEERRRIARDLHDGTSQQLAIIQVQLETLRQGHLPESIENACLDIEAALLSAHHQMRTLSYVLHPPELESGGVVDALASFLRGFARRTNLIVSFHNSAGRLKAQTALEIALYRVAQEALINVSKHAFASEVNVSLRMEGGGLVLEIEDNGIGIPSEILSGRLPEALGVGLAGMRELVEALGGVFDAECCATGTRIRARFPQRRCKEARSGLRLNDIVADCV